MTHDGLAVLFVAAGVIHLTVLGFVAWLVRDVGRMTRAVGALVYQEENKTRAQLEELGARLLGERR